MGIPLAVNFSVFPVESRDELEQAFAAIQQWSNSPAGLAVQRCRTYLVSSLSITNALDPYILTGWNTQLMASAQTEFAYDTGIVDPDGTKITITSPGVYLLQAQGTFAANVTGFRYIGIENTAYASGLSWTAIRQFIATGGCNQIEQVSVTVPVLTAPVSYRVGVYQNSGGALTLYDAWFQATRIGQV